jgi:hypothetical protein
MDEDDALVLYSVSYFDASPMRAILVPDAVLVWFISPAMFAWGRVGEMKGD